jgi:hypothetical protein
LRSIRLPNNAAKDAIWTVSVTVNRGGPSAGQGGPVTNSLHLNHWFSIISLAPYSPLHEGASDPMHTAVSPQLAVPTVGLPAGCCLVASRVDSPRRFGQPAT